MRKTLAIIIISLLLILNIWRNIIINISTQLPGWYDELFIIWIYQNNIRHFSNLDVTHIYETNAIYPFKYTLSFAEHMYFPSLLILFINIFTKNVIAQYNILLILNHILVFFAALLLFKKVLKNTSAALISTFYTSFSPYFFTEIGHFQMIFFWPLLISLYFLALFFEKDKTKILALSGIFAGIQFLSSVYLGIMNLTIIFLWYTAVILYKKYSIKDLFKQSTVILVAFILVSSVSLTGYILVNREYHIKRDYGEYVTYSANLTDYIFPARRQLSLLYSNFFFQKLKKYNHHQVGEFAAFAGILPLAFAAYKLWPKIKKTKESLNLDITFTKTATFGVILVFAGFILSLGPRLFVNGIYTEIPLPYDLILKIFSPIGIIRAVARWNFLVILGFSFLLGLGYIKLEEKFAKNNTIKKVILLSLVFAFCFVEFYSLTPFPSFYRNWQADTSYDFLKKEVCKSNTTTLLEYPFHYRNLDGDIVKDVNYMAQILLNSTRHNCKILSGYYGYEPPKYMEIRNEFADGFDDKDIKIIKDLEINYIKFNKYAISNLEYQKTKDKLNQFINIYEDKNVLILKVN